MVTSLALEFRYRYGYTIDYQIITYTNLIIYHVKRKTMKNPSSYVSSMKLLR